jgi:hypothetical protein
MLGSMQQRRPKCRRSRKYLWVMTFQKKRKEKKRYTRRKNENKAGKKKQITVQ